MLCWNQMQAVSIRIMHVPSTLRSHLKTHNGGRSHKCNQYGCAIRIFFCKSFEETPKNSYWRRKAQIKRCISATWFSLLTDRLKLRQELELLSRSKKGALQVSFDQECSCLLNPSPNLKSDVVVFYDILIGPDIWSNASIFNQTQKTLLNNYLPGE